MKQYRIKEYPLGIFSIEHKSWCGWFQIIEYTFRGYPTFYTYNSLLKAQNALDAHIKRKNFKPKYVY